MLRVRVIPCLQLVSDSLVKTVKFDNYKYIGDPINTVRIFNELGVDELCFLDIRATVENRTPDFQLLQHIADECFMPLSYGGGIKDFETVRKIFSIGFEKVVLNSSTYITPGLIKKLTEYFGSQAIIAAVDIKKTLFGGHMAFINSGTKKIPVNVVEWVQQLEANGAGELLVTSIDKDGTWAGYDLEVLKKINNAVTIPVIANGGAGELKHLSDAVKKAGVAAVALGSMVVYQKKDMGVLINFPDENILKKFFHNI